MPPTSQAPSTLATTAPGVPRTFRSLKTGRRRPGGFWPRAGYWSLGLSSIALCLVFWQFASARRWDLGVITFSNVPSPIQSFEAGQSLLCSPKIAAHIRNSLFRVFTGFAAASAVGIALGITAGRSRWAASILLPPLEVLRPIPGVAWIPLALLMFPSSELSMIFIAFIGAVFPILLNTILGVNGIDARLIAASRSLGAGRWSIFREVVLPGSLPGIATGLSIGTGTSWFCLVAAEMLAGRDGIGYFTWESYRLRHYPELVAGMVFIGVIGMAGSALVAFIGSCVTPWARMERSPAK